MQLRESEKESEEELVEKENRLTDEVNFLTKFSDNDDEKYFPN